MSFLFLGLASFGKRLTYVRGFLELWRIRNPYSKSSLGTLLGVTKVGSLLDRYLSSHFGVDSMLIDCWFLRADNLADVVGGHIVFTMDGIWCRSEVLPGANTVSCGVPSRSISPTMLSSRVQKLSGCGPDPVSAECCLNLGNLHNVFGTSYTSR